MHLSLLFAFSLVALLAAEADAMRSPRINEEKLQAYRSMGLKAEWKAFKAKYSKSYKTAEEEKRRKKIFAQNLKEIEAHNGEGFTLGINPYTDMEASEFAELMTGYKPPPRSNGRRFFQFTDTDRTSKTSRPPKKIDWVSRGYVTPVKDQNPCGSCYAFSAIGALEGQHYRKTGKLVSLSAQQIVDCSTEDGGCHGGFPETSLTYIANNGGVATEESYPYEAAQGPCRFRKSRVTVGATCTSYMEVYPSEQALMKAVAEVGPISVAIYANNDTFRHYQDGVYNDPDCFGLANHAVLVVGYGQTKSGKKYWLVKNSWGKNWGNEGFIFMSRDKKNQCGIADNAVYPII